MSLFLHIEQYWRKTTILNGITYISPQKLEHLTQVISLDNTPLRVKYEFKQFPVPKHGYESYLIDENCNLILQDTDYDTSD
jgi:hypothetical protein